MKNSYLDNYLEKIFWQANQNNFFFQAIKNDILILSLIKTAFFAFLVLIYIKWLIENRVQTLIV